ncbi:MAG TPA: hypothetical protein VNA04_13850 [Thermoanaerobaculia bacterium]|nr:hypothetical protein [Thermoanaerobaculia bacterium]
MPTQTIRAALLAAGTAAIALAVRLPSPAVVAPFDELYHWKRIAWSVRHFPAVLELDPDRGIGGAFCPWPPLYDLSAAAIALLAGARDEAEVLRVIVWIPPAVASILIALVVGIAARSRPIAAAVMAVPLAGGPFLVFASSPGDIDHHFLEPFLVLAVIGGVVLSLRARGNRQIITAAAVLGLAMAAALFVQAALILAAALAFLAMTLLSRTAEPLTASAAAFALAALAVTAYRVTRLPGFPDGPWFLGWTHVSLLAGAALACAVTAILDRRGGRSPAAAGVAMLAGAALVCAVPGAALSLFGGIRFFGGDAWLGTIEEFQPVWRPLARLPNYAAGLAIGAAAGTVLLVRAVRRRHPYGGVVALFAVTYIIATVPSRRFSIIATVLATIVAALLVEILWLERRSRSAAALALLVVLVPPLQLASWWMGPGRPSAERERSERVAHWLRERPGDGRVLAPWSYGHMLHVLGKRPVIVDNFGSMSDPVVFREAHAVLLSRNEEDVAAFLEKAGVRYVVLQTPQRGIASHARVLGLPLESFFHNGAPTAYTRSTWYWRAFFDHEAELPFRRTAIDRQVLVLERLSAGDARPPASAPATARTPPGRPQRPASDR